MTRNRISLFFATLFFLSSILPVSAREIRVLIIDERFTDIPDPEMKIEIIGNIKGELLVSGVSYRGNIEVWKGKNGLYLVNQVPLESYVKSVVLSEVADGWEMEALKTQAVLARTYAIRHMKQGDGKLYHLTSSTLHQLYRGDQFDGRVAYAVMQTEGEILSYNGEAIEAFYHSTCGGRSELPEEVFGRAYPYLKSVTSNCFLSPYWVWQKRMTTKEIEKSLGISGINGLNISDFTKTGRVKELALLTEGGIERIASKDFRRLLGWKTLPSTWFTLEQRDSSYVFNGRGYGHGVGLCQWGSQWMAKEGKSYREILAYYYPGTVITLYEGR
jgi:stage II sporulation protein D